jgi:hypothetical protein
MQAVSRAEARNRRKELVLDGFAYAKTQYFGPAWAPGDAMASAIPVERRPAQAFLVEQAPGSVLKAHFHCVNQFQVVVGGGGSIGRHAVRPLAVHYAGAFTGYGPIVAGERGLAYFTLRSQYDFGAHFLPEALDELADVERKFILSEEVPVSAAEELGALRGCALQAVTAPDGSGLAAFVARVGPGAQLEVPADDFAGGEHWIVAAGSLQAAGSEELDALSCLYFARGELARRSFAAGAAGAQVLILQYPRDANPRPRAAMRLNAY